MVEFNPVYGADRCENVVHFHVAAGPPLNLNSTLTLTRNTFARIRTRSSAAWLQNSRRAFTNSPRLRSGGKPTSSDILRQLQTVEQYSDKGQGSGEESKYRSRQLPTMDGMLWLIGFVPIFTFGLGTWQIQRLKETIHLLSYSLLCSASPSRANRSRVNEEPHRTLRAYFASPQAHREQRP